MAYYIRYEWIDDFNGAGYVRSACVNKIDFDLVQPVQNGLMAAHDYVEHPYGYPLGTIEDEIAAYGAIMIGRLPAGMIGGPFWSPDSMIAHDLREMLELYCDGGLASRRRHWGSNPAFAEDITEMVTEDKALQRRILGWIHHGVTRARQRFQTDTHMLDMYCSFERAFDEAMESNPDTFSLRVCNHTSQVIPFIH